MHPSECSDEEHRALLAGNVLYGRTVTLVDSDVIQDPRVRRGLKTGDGFHMELFRRRAF